MASRGAKTVRLHNVALRKSIRTSSQRISCLLSAPYAVMLHSIVVFDLQHQAMPALPMSLYFKLSSGSAISLTNTSVYNNFEFFSKTYCVVTQSIKKKPRSTIVLYHKALCYITNINILVMSLLGSVKMPHTNKNKVEQNEKGIAYLH